LGCSTNGWERASPFQDVKKRRCLTGGGKTEKKRVQKQKRYHLQQKNQGVLKAPS